jgi:hypothetical protein
VRRFAPTEPGPDPRVRSERPPESLGIRTTGSSNLLETRCGRAVYSIRGGDSPVTNAMNPVRFADGAGDRLVPALGPHRSSAITRKLGHGEILVLRQQLAVLKRGRPRPPLQPIDRAFWVVVSRVWSRWADALAIVKPATVIAWHRRGFARFGAWKSRRVGRPPLAPAVVALIAQMARYNPLWSRRRIANELAKLGHHVGKDAVASYMPRPAGRPTGPPSASWATFVRAHLADTLAVDFLTVPTVPSACCTSSWCSRWSAVACST